MRVGKCLFVLGLAVCLWADSKKVTKKTVNWADRETTEYHQGDRLRIEWEDSANHTAFISIPGASYDIDFERKEYVERTWTVPPKNTQSAVAPHAIKRDPRNTIDIFYETVDTGERKQFFGKTASHLILRRRDVPRTKDCGGIGAKYEREGWYVSQEYHGELGAFFLGGPTSDFCRFPSYVTHGALPLLVPMVETVDGITTEVVELSDAPLDASLFELPAGFTKVKLLQQPESPWQEKLLMQWQALRWRVQSLF